MDTSAVPVAVDHFLAEVLPKQRGLTTALHRGDPGPRIAMWSHDDPVTLFGAQFEGVGWVELEDKFRQAAKGFGGALGFEFDVVAAGVSGSLAYVVGYEHSSTVVDGKPATYTMRTTHIYRFEENEWRIIHRHSDIPGPR
ncbi:YybH family protein [Paenarthrobacter sp. NPDC057981]|uniref:YybH family protein n=1 Tax=Paenarthrobacter sp. NPDC057981 TaxID=3346297 RepID=UPI0036DD85AE